MNLERRENEDQMKGQGSWELQVTEEQSLDRTWSWDVAKVRLRYWPAGHGGSVGAMARQGSLVTQLKQSPKPRAPLKSSFQGKWR